jgi:hypothetical protein
VWQRLHAELEGRGLTVVTVALDIDPADARPFIDVAEPTHPSLIDTAHVTDELFGFTNVPMAVWIDESGTLVRPAEHASVQRSPLRDMEIPEGLPDRLDRMFREVRKLTDQSEDYRAAILDWVENGSSSAFALSPDQVTARSGGCTADQARAAACFELGQHLWRTVGEEAAIPWWKQAHALFPENWTYKRQAWTLATTAEDAAAPDLIQEAGEVYGTSWLDDVLRLGGGERYYPEAQL